jgi:glycosyltransferase involved in cell wall biosynthesis
MKKLIIFALAAHGKGISGGDRIFIELARRWSLKFPINIFLWEEGKKMLERQNLQVSEQNSRNGICIFVSKIPGWTKRYFPVNYLYRVFEGIKLGLTVQLENIPELYVYNASEFWMDSLPTVILKLRFPKIKWIATWFQTAPNPLKGYVEQTEKNKVHRVKKYSLSAFLYWLSQLPIKPLITAYADKVIVNNEDEKKRFPLHSKNGNTIVLIGAVPLESIKKWNKSSDGVKIKKTYEAVFQGRFHPQKGVLELIDIWKKVTGKKPSARLAMIGDGPLRKNVEYRIKNLGLEKNIKLFGYVFDGPEKYNIFASSKIVVHPAFYDSGGMASAEAMAFGLPCIGFDLKAYESYYPKGMIKVAVGDKEAFANQILKLLENKNYYDKVSKEASDTIEKNWSWEVRANEILKKIQQS